VAEVRDVVRLGLASAGVGAGLLGFALLGPQIGAAFADDGDGSSMSAPSATESGASRQAATREGRSLVTRKHVAARAEQTADDDTGAEPASDERAARRAARRTARDERVAAKIDELTSDAQAWIDARPVSDARKDRLERGLTTVRRTLFNQAPEVSPVQITGVVDGPITGTVGGADPDGDRIVYRVATRPETGSVTVNRDGSYTYTPGADFTGVDTFTVTARDIGSNINLLNWFRPAGTTAGMLVNQGAIRFEFRYEDGAENWTPDRRAALDRVADNITEYLRVTAPVALVYRVEGENDPAERWLAGANSSLVSDDPGFWRTVVQNKIISGIDANGDADDGLIAWNFAFPTAVGDVVTGDDFDFTSIVMHELMHSFGIIGHFGPPGTNATRRNWSIWDSLMASADGTTLVGDDYAWPESADHYVLGADGGVLFSGANAVAAYGGKLVPVYSPSTWEPGSSGSHLDTDTFTGDDYQLMNHRIKTRGAQGIRELSPIEMGILRDLGYLVVPPTLPSTANRGS